MKKKLRIRWSVEMMCNGGFRLRFLTLTVPEDGLPLKVVTSRFRALRSTRFMRSFFRRCQYVCVYEKHPQGHGWHIHIVINRYLDINALRCLALRYGFGRLHIELCGKEIGKYVAKYVSKTMSQRPDDCKGLRLCNVSRSLLALRDVVFHSPQTDFVKLNWDNSFLRSLKPFQRLRALDLAWTFRNVRRADVQPLSFLTSASGLVFPSII